MARHRGAEGWAVASLGWVRDASRETLVRVEAHSLDEAHSQDERVGAFR